VDEAQANSAPITPEAASATPADAPDADVVEISEAELADEERGPNHKAVIVAINQYEGCPLNGCINDGTQDHDEAVNNYGFDGTFVRGLFDSRATTLAIWERLKWLVQDAKPGDILFFAYSGHGAQATCRDECGEVDGLHEVICPVDFDWTPEHMITDKQFVALFSTLPKGVKLFWISDSCHSGDLDRAITIKTPNNPKIKIPKSFAVPADVAWALAAAKKAGHKPTALRQFIEKYDVAFVPGCKSNQTSTDTSVEGRPCGALHYAFWDAVHRLGKNATVKAITDYARTTLANDGYDQEPIANGSLIDGPWLR
jgi:hypothetical protein